MPKAWEDNDRDMKRAAEVSWKQYAMEERRQRIAAQAALRAAVTAWDSLKPGQYDKDILDTWLGQKMKPAIDQARSAVSISVDALPDQIVRLIIAARVVAFSNRNRTAIKELDAASEAFAECVPWADQPKDH